MLINSTAHGSVSPIRNVYKCLFKECFCNKHFNTRRLVDFRVRKSWLSLWNKCFLFKELIIITIIQIYLDFFDWINAVWSYIKLRELSIHTLLHFPFCRGLGYKRTYVPFGCHTIWRLNVWSVKQSQTYRETVS